MGDVPASVDQALATPGTPLDVQLRSDMEGRFGHDFSRVRVHSGAAAEQSTAELNAKAYTVGHHIVFGADHFAPQTPAGRHLLAHELTHVVQQSSGATAIQRAPETDDDDEAAARPRRPVICAGGAMPYNGVCLTDEVLDVLPAVGDVHEAERIVKANVAEKKAQARVAEKHLKLSNAELNRKIDQMRESVARSDQPGAIPASLRRLLKERDRRRALPISQPTRVDQAIAMLEEAWSLAEKEDPPDIRRASYLVHVVNTWLQKATPPLRYDECFSGMAKTTAITSVGYAKGNVNDLEHKFRLGATIGGWWPATINSLKAVRELVQIMSGEKRIEETKFNAISKTINRTAVATPLIGAGIMALPALVASGLAIPALPATIQGVSTAVWIKTAVAAGLSATYLGHVVTRSEELANTEGGSKSIFRRLGDAVRISSAAVVDTSGGGKMFEAATNQSLLTEEALHHTKGERAVGGIIGVLEFGLNLLGVKDLIPEPVPRVTAPRPATPEPLPEPVPLTAPKTEPPVGIAGETTVAPRPTEPAVAAPAVNVEAPIAPKLDPVATKPAVGTQAPKPPPVIEPDPRLVQAEQRLATNQAKADVARARLKAAGEKATTADEAAKVADADLALAREEAKTARAAHKRAERAYEKAKATKDAPRAEPRREFYATRDAAEEAEQNLAKASTRAKAAKADQRAAKRAVPTQEAAVSRAERNVVAAERERAIEIEADRIRKLPHNVEDLRPGWDYTRFPQGPRRAWKPGDAVNMPDANGTYPGYPTVRKRIWINRATDELAARAAGTHVRATIPPKPTGPVEPSPAGWDPFAATDAELAARGWQKVPEGGLPWLDPIRLASDAQLAEIATSGKVPWKLGAEIEHARIPQRVGELLEEAGVNPNVARRVTKVGDPDNLMPTVKEIHAIVDEYARLLNPNRNPTLRFSLDVRATAPFREATDAELTTIVQAITDGKIVLSRTQAGRALRDALEAEKKLRPSSTWTVPD
jgi:hypothetical protein